MAQEEEEEEEEEAAAPNMEMPTKECRNSFKTHQIPAGMSSKANSN